MLFHETIGEVPTPPDLPVTARRALRRPVERRPSRLGAVIAAVASILLVAAIIGYNLVSHHRSAPPSQTGGAPLATPTVLPTATPSPSGPLPCTAGQLSLTPGGTQGAAGHIFASITLTNSSTVPCTISGFPTAQLLSSDRTPVPTRVVDRGGQLSNTPPAAIFLLAPSQKAQAQLSWGDVPVGNEACRTASSIEVGPPGQAPSPALLVANLAITICNSGELDASALAPAG